MFFKHEIFYDIRRKQRFSASDLAKELGVSRNTIYNWEKGISKPSKKAIIKLAAALNIPPNVITNLPGDFRVETSIFKDVLKVGLTVFETKRDLIDNKNLVFSALTSLYSKLSNASVIIDGIFRTIHYPIYVKDINNNYIIANKSFLDILRLEKNFDYRGMSDFHIFSKNEAEKNSIEDMHILLTGEAILDVERFMPGTRKKRMTLASKVPVYDKGKIVGLVGAFVDITEQKREEERRVFLEKIIDSLECYALIIKKNTDKKEKYTLEYANKSGLNRIYSNNVPNDLNLTEQWKELAPNHRKIFINKIEKAKKFPVRHKYWTNHPNTDRKSFFLEKIFNPEPGYYFVISYDVNEISNIYEYTQPRLSFNKQNDIIKWEGFVNHDINDIVLHNTSENVESITGYTAEYVFEQKLSIKRLIPAEYYDLFNEWFQNIENIPVYEHWIIKKNGKQVLCETKVKLKNIEGQLICYGATREIKKTEKTVNNLKVSQTFTYQSIRMKEKQIIAQKLIQENIDINIISKATGLSLDVVNKLSEGAERQR